MTGQGKLDKIAILKNPVQEYAWGSRTAIQRILGNQAPSVKGKPAAELWMGGHPRASSEVFIHGMWESLHKIIKKDPESILGARVARRFSNNLPFLFKVLAADKPLSLQVHPDIEQAQAGFEREERLNIPLTSADRNYKDKNHKPEILCALTTFHALKGFRELEEIIAIMSTVSLNTLSDELSDLKKNHHSHGLRHFFTSLIGMDMTRQQMVLDKAVILAERHVGEDPVYEWILRLNQIYPGDIGVLSPAMLNLVKLSPGEAIHIFSGELHSYLQGVGIELMANSDNVLRGGLTPKHKDMVELLNILTFKTGPVEIMRPVKNNASEKIYPAYAEEFLLSVISVDKTVSFTSPTNRSVEILICMEGGADIEDLGSGDILPLTKGRSIIIPAAVSQYRIDGKARFYKASVPPGPFLPANAPTGLYEDLKQAAPPKISDASKGKRPFPPI